MDFRNIQYKRKKNRNLYIDEITILNFLINYNMLLKLLLNHESFNKITF